MDNEGAIPRPPATDHRHVATGAAERAMPEPLHETPVLLVHGILGQRHVYWNLFRRRLRGDGFRVLEAKFPYLMLGDLRIAARFLKDKVEGTLRGEEAEQVDLVCHSAGGLVARYYIKYLGGDKQVRRLILLGTPHHGTYFSYLFAPSLFSISRQSRPGSHFLAEINGPGAIPEGVNVTNIWSPVDGIVLPPESAVLTGANNVKLPLVTHWGFLWRPTVYKVVLDVLQGKQGASPTDQGSPDAYLVR